MSGRPVRRSTRSKRPPHCDAPDRGLSPVVGKTLELGIGVLLVALLTATLFGGIVPEYRSAVGDELGERTLVAGAERIEAAVPRGDPVALERTVTVRLPPTIRGDPYRVVVDGTETAALRLVHPDRSIGGRVRLAVPAAASLAGSWTSTSPSRIRISVAGGSGRPDRAGPTLSVRLVDGEVAVPGGREGSA